MKKILMVLGVAALVAGAALSSPEADVMATVKGFVVAFNKGDTTAAKAACANETSIIDEFAPHEGRGAGACQRWMNDWSSDADIRTDAGWKMTGWSWAKH